MRVVGGGVHGQCGDRDVYRRRVKVGVNNTWGGGGCSRHTVPMNMYVPLFTCSKDDPPG